MGLSFWHSFSSILSPVFVELFLKYVDHTIYIWYRDLTNISIAEDFICGMQIFIYFHVMIWENPISLIRAI